MLKPSFVFDVRNAAQAAGQHSSTNNPERFIVELKLHKQLILYWSSIVEVSGKDEHLEYLYVDVCSDV